MNAKTLEAITRHGETLLRAFPNATEKNPVALCKKLRRIENGISQIILRNCNEGVPEDELDAATDGAQLRASKLLGGVPTICRNSSMRKCPSCGTGIFGVHAAGCAGGSHKIESVLYINRDPRGHALKLDDAWVRDFNQTQYAAKLPALHTDMGGYGILAPDLNQ